MSRAVRAWWPVAAWVAVIVTATTIAVPDTGMGRLRFPADKAVHFALYLGLGWSMGRALWVQELWSVRTVLAALLGGLAFAALDEWHQSLLYWREGSFSDWLADAAGVSVGLALYLWPRWRTWSGRSAGGRLEPPDARVSEAPGRRP